jgi:hypothetical protein
MSKHKQQDAHYSSEPLEQTLQRMQLAEAKVQTMNGYYYVTLLDGSCHIVGKDKKCVEHGCTCLSVAVVSKYLKNGGEKAPNGEHIIPEVCPICGGEVQHEPKMMSMLRKVAWICKDLAEEERITGGFGPFHIYGNRHYWQSQKLERVK